jgi:hypothetical protein
MERVLHHAFENAVPPLETLTYAFGCTADGGDRWIADAEDGHEVGEHELGVEADAEPAAGDLETQ